MKMEKLTLAKVRSQLVGHDLVLCYFSSSFMTFTVTEIDEYDDSYIIRVEDEKRGKLLLDACEVEKLLRGEMASLLLGRFAIGINFKLKDIKK